MKPLDDEIARLDAEIARLQGERVGLLRARTLLAGDPSPLVDLARKRSPAIKPIVLDIMRDVQGAGATSADVDARVRLAVPSVAKDTVGSVLSRLKSDGALAYDGERYYEKRYAPSVNPAFRVVS